MPILLFSILTLVVFGLDFISKGIVRSHLPLGADVKIFSFFSLTHIQNTGIAFGLFPEKNSVFAVISLMLVALIGIIAWKSMRRQVFGLVSLALILGGAFGNLADRIRFGHVTDFLDFYVGAHHWPAFNVADSAICVGAFFLFFQSLKPAGR
jgi:signal peptidase II